MDSGEGLVVFGAEYKSASVSALQLSLEPGLMPSRRRDEAREAKPDILLRRQRVVGRKVGGSTGLGPAEPALFHLIGAGPPLHSAGTPKAARSGTVAGTSWAPTSRDGSVRIRDLFLHAPAECRQLRWRDVVAISLSKVGEECPHVVVLEELSY